MVVNGVQLERYNWRDVLVSKCCWYTTNNDALVMAGQNKAESTQECDDEATKNEDHDGTTANVAKAEASVNN